MSKQQIGVVGMAVMGRNLALNIESRGYTVSIFNRSREKTEEVIAETALLLENVNLPEDAECVFRSNHASNYLSLAGNLPADKEKMLAQLRRAMQDRGMLKDERFRAL